MDLDKLERKREVDRKASKKYYENNKEEIKRQKREKYFAEKGYYPRENNQYVKNGITMTDTETGDSFNYNSVKSCSEDMGIGAHNIYRSLKYGDIVQGYLFTKEVHK